MSIFASNMSNIETDTIVFKIYYIILEFIIFKVTVEHKAWYAAEKVELGFESGLLFFWYIWNNFNYYKTLFKLGNTLKY